MKTVAVLVPTMAGGGAERVVATLVRTINREKFRIHLILVRAEGPYMELLPDTIKITSLNAGHVRYALIKLTNVLNTVQPDIVFSTLDELNLGLVLIKPFLRKKPKIILREANTPSKSLSTLSPLKKKSVLFLYTHFYPRADLIIAQCMAMRADILHTYKLSSEKVTHIYNPLDIDTIIKQSFEGNPYPEGLIHLLAVGRLSYQKGFDILLEAVRIVLQTEPTVHLTVIGEGSLKQELSTLSEKLEIDQHVQFLGFKKNPYPYYRYADAYILSSRWEGFPNSLLEALACGTKVVATDCPSGPREILLDNAYGTLVPASDPQALAEGILHTIKSKNKSGKRAEAYRVEAIIEEYEKVFNTV
ncbi:Alpha-1,4-N-acetylgalactosamine transferase PglJ [Alkalibacterium sp. AK22]|uniref:glycosyltransferase n=1 Tax=Alkalibacterium sp. AK22 TaxID=1229520 RepID=UPI0004527600|nr:glycosyltransferase [Alkalibacterium sp. AK22]EXJ23344.1 Alpha-1,4-N-acetylgalactosamine transferase PglJ [Alkalibacterium sp. AK22]